VTHRDRPDVLLEMPDRTIGIEITEAVPANWAKTSALHEDREYDTLMFTPRCKPGEPARPTAERDWADAMLHFTEMKAAKFSKPGFIAFDKNWLLIYDNWPAPAVDERKAAEYFLGKLGDRGGTRPFDAIFVEGKKHFWHFENRQVHVAQINDVWTEQSGR